MPSFAPNYSPRWRGHYRIVGVTHTMQLRAARDASGVTMDGYEARAREIFDSLAPLVSADLEWISAEYALTDSDVFIPSTTPHVGTTGGITPTDFAITERILGTTFSGRAPGSRSRLTVFGVRWDFDTIGADEEDTIITPDEFSGIGGVIATLNTYGHAGSGALAVWHNRATLKVNDRLLRDVRRGVIH